MKLSPSSLPILQKITVVAVVAMIFLVAAWELWLAPMNGSPSWVVLKAFILMLPLRGLLHGRRYTYQWYTMFVLLFFMLLSFFSGAAAAGQGGGGSAGGAR